MSQWISILSFLICPLMMLFCMKGMFSKNSHCSKEKISNGSADIVSQITELKEQNEELRSRLEKLS